MAMKRCPVCGEKYSDTYRRCPFCEEEAALRSGNARRKGGHRVAQKGPSLLSPLLIVAIVVMAAVLIYLLFGDAIAQKLGMGKSDGLTPPPVSSVSSAPAVSDGSASSQMEDGDPSALPETLTLSKSDFTMNVGDTPVALSVADGGSGYRWTSTDEGVASVDENGNVIAISAGTVTVTAYNESGRGSCVVRVKGSGTPNTATPTGTTPSGTGADTTGEPLTLNKSDVSIKVEESFSLTVSGASGTSGTVSYTSENPAVAAVTDGGKVTGKARGTVTVTVTADGKTGKCIVRVK